ncbi:MAG TPA: TIM barrel protein [Chloroflexota bacterium]|nr:TIM barrel protein [Chloroflexota bacterium]
MHIGSAPDSWGVWFANDPGQVPWPRFLDEMALAGYEWVELGPHGYLPTDPSQLSDEVAARGLKVAGGTVPGALHRPEHWAADVEAASNVAKLANAVGAKFVVFLPHGARQLDPDAWCRMVSGADELGKLLRQEYGVELVFHPHANTYVETQAQIERLLADSTVQLCLDTGHVAYGRGDNLALIAKYPERIGYVHLKQIDPLVLDQVQAEGLDFAQAVQRGVCPEPPAGVPSFEALAKALHPLGDDLFGIVEQDLYPCAPDVPLPIAQRTRAYLRRCGFEG